MPKRRHSNKNKQNKKRNNRKTKKLQKGKKRNESTININFLNHDCAVFKCDMFGSAGNEKVNQDDIIKSMEMNQQYKFIEFIKTLNVNYKPIKKLSFCEKIERIKQNIQNIQCYGAKDVKLKVLDQSLRILHSFEEEDDEKMNINQTVINEIHCDILLNIGNILLLKSETNANINDIVTALNHFNMILYINKTAQSNLFIHFLRIKCLFRLGLFEKAESMLKTFEIKLKSLEPLECGDEKDKIPSNYQEIFAKERNSPIAENINSCIKEFEKVLLRYCDSSNKSTKFIPKFVEKMFNFFYCPLRETFMYNILFLSISHLLQCKQWEMKDLCDFCRSLDVLELDTITVSDILPQCIGIISIILKWQPMDVMQCINKMSRVGLLGNNKPQIFDVFDMFISSFSAYFKYDKFIYSVIAQCAKKWEWKKSKSDELRSNYDNHYDIQYINKDEQQHGLWLHLFQLINHWKTSSQVTEKKLLTKCIPKHGRTKGSEMYLPQPAMAQLQEENIDFILIHAAMTAVNAENALKEIENINLMDLNLYSNNITFLHFFALNGCIETVKFLIKYGMDINALVCNKEITNIVHTTSESSDINEFFHIAPMSALDLCNNCSEIIKNNASNMDQFILAIFSSNTLQRQLRIGEGIKILTQFGAKSAKQILGKQEYEKKARKIKSRYQQSKDFWEQLDNNDNDSDEDTDESDEEYE